MIRRKTDINPWVVAAGLGLLYAMRVAIRLSRAYDLRGKSVLIAGGSRGLGLLLAQEFAHHGAFPAICARSEKELFNAAEELRRRGVSVVTSVCDLTRKEEVDRMLQEVRTKLGSIDVLVNNASVIQVGPFEVMDLNDYRDAIDIHFWAPLHTILGVLPEMMQRRSGRIVNISSIGGKIAVPHLLPYSAGKFALTGLSGGLRAELRKYNIAVTTVYPGLMRTGSPRNAFFKGKHRHEYAWFSIFDSIPGISMNAERAARLIVEACINGDAELVLGLPAKIVTGFHGVFPALTQELMELMNLLLPAPGGIGTERAYGRESQSNLSPSWLTLLTEKAARAHNQIQ